MSRGTNPDHDAHRRPDGASDEAVAAAGKMSEALETVERARGHLYTFHQLIGHADAQLQDAADLLDDAGHGGLAEAVRSDVVGRNVLYGRWTFQIVEEFDDGYFHTLRTAEERVRHELTAGRRHVYESEMKERERTEGSDGHERRPDDPV